VEPSTFVEIVRSHAETTPDLGRYTFIAGRDGEERVLTDRSLERRARAIAANLRCHISAGERVLLLYPPGLDFIEAFFGCLFAGVTAVPVYPPDPMRLERTMPRLTAVIADSRPAVVITTAEIFAVRKALFDSSPELKRLSWIPTDTIEDAESSDWTEPVIGPKATALLQYTSGSTSTPKGVVISHGNLIANSRLIQNAFQGVERDVRMTWLPPYHDMGLIGAIIQPLYGGGSTALMSPMDF
jgi:acyl-CoA synthetase (AMP-forming)/AMP-acid ligase II